MNTIIEKTFNQDDFACPICGSTMVPPVDYYCDHIAFYCVRGPVDGPQMEYLEEGLTLSVDDISSKNKMLTVGEENGLSIYELTEKDAYYPTTIILGVKS